IPFTRKRLELWAIKTHGQVECPLRRGQPVDFPVFAGTFVLKVKVERSIRVGLEGKVTADRKTIEPVRYLKAFAIIECDGPESVHGRRSTLVEVDRVFVRAVERLAGVVEQVERIDGVLGKIGAETELG